MTLSDGRTLAYALLGAEAGLPLFFFHGTPGSRLDFSSDDLLAQLPNVKLILPERPGFGKSSPQSNRTFEGWARDVAELADHLGFPKFSVAGGSGGGPHTLACAYYLSARVLGAYVFASPAPADFKGATKGMSIGNRLGLWLSGTKLLPRLIDSNVKMMQKTPDRFMRSLLAQLSEPDREFFKDPEYQAAAKVTLLEAYRQGSGAHIEDARLAMSKHPWGFDLRQIAVPVHIWQGGRDTLVPRLMGERLHDLIPESKFYLVPQAGHLLIDREDVVRQFEAIFAAHSQ